MCSILDENLQIFLQMDVISNFIDNVIRNLMCDFLGCCKRKYENECYSKKDNLHESDDIFQYTCTLAGIFCHIVVVEQK